MINKLAKKSGAICVFVLLNVATVSEAIITSDEIGSHSVSAGDRPYSLNLDGVALLGGFKPNGAPTGTCTGALITDVHVLTAAHCLDTDGDFEVDPLLLLFPSEVLFQLNGEWISVDYDPTKATWPTEWETAGGDIAVVTLESEAPANIPRYSLYGGDAEIGQSFVLAGFGHAGLGSTGEDPGFDSIPVKRAGLNRYEAIYDEDEGVEYLVYDFDSGIEENNSLALTGFTSDLGFGVDEVLTANRDSGGPGFLNGAIASVGAFGDRLPDADINDELDSSWGEAGFDARVSHFHDFIISATDGRAVFVPEPDLLTTTTLMSVWLGLLRCRVRRSE